MMDAEFLEDRSCLRAQCNCLCGLGTCRLCCRWCPRANESTNTRVVYVILLMMGVTVMSIMMSKQIQDEILDLFPDDAKVCEWVGAGADCEAAIGYMAVYRLGLAICVYHLILALSTWGVSTSRGCRAGLHNGMWFHKFILMVGLSVAAFFIPDPQEYFIHSWMYVSMAGAGIFIVIQLVLFIIMLHNWTDKIKAYVNEGGVKCCCCWFMTTMVVVMSYVICVIAGFFLFYFFAYGDKCHRNQWFILINAGACIIVSIVSAVKKSNKPVALRLFHSSLVSLYVMYLTWTAIESAPRKYQTGPTHITGSSHGTIQSFNINNIYYCGPNHDEKTWTDDVVPYISVAFMFFMVVYSSIGTAEPDSCHALDFPNCPVKYSNEQINEEDIGGQKINRNEKYSLMYSYPLFHLMLALATLYMMLSLTGWYTPDHASLRHFGRSWSAVWIKMGSSWICLCAYMFTVLFPTVIPRRRRSSLMIESITNGHLIEEDIVVPLNPNVRPPTIHQETTV